MCYAVVWQRVTGATPTQHSAQHTHHTCDMLPHHRITYNDVVFYWILI
jgi:hypothetical protein